MKIEIKDVLKGIVFFIYSWIVFTFVSFIIFEPTSIDTAPILFVTAILIAISYFAVKSQSKTFTLTIVLIVLILTILYLVPVNNNISDEAIQFNNQISENNLDRIEYAKELFFATEKKWDSPIREYLRQPQKSFFIKDFEVFWNIQGYAPSNIQAQMYRRLLLDSNRFTEEEVIFRQNFCTTSPHGYIEIVEEDRIIWADLWAVDQFPREDIEEAYMFGQRTSAPCDILEGVGVE